MGLAKSAPNEGVAVPSRSRNRPYHEKEATETARPGQAAMHKGRKHQRERIQKGNNFGRKVLCEGQPRNGRLSWGVYHVLVSASDFVLATAARLACFVNT